MLLSEKLLLRLLNCREPYISLCYNQKQFFFQEFIFVLDKLIVVIVSKTN